SQIGFVDFAIGERLSEAKVADAARVVWLVMRTRHDELGDVRGDAFRSRSYPAMVDHCPTAGKKIFKRRVVR
ncbi:MAG TPA: hypothetical protein VMS23_04660, partial [Terrimicrobiaceae bacterium]|nr:hypothetical protein [Terrimicrobiaceae bacterium]